MGVSDDIKKKAEIADLIEEAFAEIGIEKHRWLRDFGADSEPQIDLIIKEASEKAKSIVKMNESEFEKCVERESAQLLKKILAHGNLIDIEEVDEKEDFENERRENGNLKERIS